MPRMPLQPCDHCYSNTSNVTSASENIKLKIMEDKLRNDFAEKEHIHEQYLTEEQVLEKHYTKEETDSAIQKAAIEGKVDLTGYATEEWVESKKYLTEHQDISGKQDNIEDLEEIREGANLGKTALQEIPAEYITEEELEAKKYLTEHQDISHLAEKDHVHDQYLTEHQSLEGYAKESFVEQKVAELVDSAPEALNTLNELAVAINNHEDAYDALLETVGGKAEKEHTHDQYLTEHQSLEGYAKLTDIPSIEGLVNEEYVDNAISQHIKPEVYTLDFKNYKIDDYVSEVDAHFLDRCWENGWKDVPLVAYVNGCLVKSIDLSSSLNRIVTITCIAETYRDSENHPNTYYQVEKQYKFTKFETGQNYYRWQVTDITDVTDYIEDNLAPTKKYVDNVVANIEIPEAYDDSELRNLISEKAASDHIHDQYLTEDSKAITEVNQRIDNLNIPSIEGLASEEFVKEEINKIEIPEPTDLTGYATETFVLAEIAKAQLEGDDVDLSGYATKDDLNVAKAELQIAIENIELKEGPQGPAGSDGTDGKDGVDGKDFTYDMFTEEQLEALRGPQGEQGPQGEKGDKGEKGAAGADGKTAFELAQANGFDGDERAWLDSLKGADGQQGEQGPKGDPGKDGRDGLTTTIKIGDAIYIQEDGVINLPEKSELFIVDFNNPNYNEAKTAYEERKLVVLINAAPDINSYAMMNYVSDTYITFTKFLMSRSETYGAFNTYYLKNDNSWEIAKEVKLNKVEITADGNLQIGKELYETPNIEGLVSKEYADNTYTTYEEIKANFMDSEEVAQKISTDIDYNIGLLRDELNSSIGEVSTVAYDAHSLADNAYNLATETSRYAGEIGEQLPGINQYISDVETQVQQASEYAGQVSLDVQNLSTSVATDIQLINENKADRTELFSKDYNELYNTPEIPSIDGLATEQFVENKLAELIDTAPETLNTLGELATAIGENGDLLETLNSAVADKADKTALEDLNTTLSKKIEENTVLYNELNDTVSNLVIPENLSELVNDANYTDEERVLELIKNNASAKIGIDFTPNITVGYLGPNTPITADMTIGQIIHKMLYCEHDWVISTCGKPYVCEFCGHDHPTLITDHTPETYGADIDASCSYPGSSMGVKCGDCGEILVPSEIIPQLPHEPSAPSIEVEPTCTEPGESVIRCNHCGEYIDRSSVPALGHDYIDEVTLNPTCTEDGVRTYICSNGCGETYTEVIPALGHNYIKDETKSTEATCESAGLLVEICEICEDRKETTIEALGHKYTSEVTLEPTCEEDGVRTYTCNNGCGESYTEAISKLGHKQAIREENRIEPDCTNDGSYEKVAYCTECNEVLSRETIVLSALGHDYGDWVITKQPEVNVPGEQTKTCKRCGNVITEVIPALEPEEPATLSYLAGTFGNPDLDQDVQDCPDFLEDFTESEQEAITMHYVNNMTEYSVASEGDLVGRHGFAIKTPFVKEPDLIANDYGGVVSVDPYQTRPAIILPAGYSVTAWNTDVDNSSLSECTLGSYILTDGRTVYYAADFPQLTGTTTTHYLTISKN